MHRMVLRALLPIVIAGAALGAQTTNEPKSYTFAIRHEPTHPLTGTLTVATDGITLTPNAGRCRPEIAETQNRRTTRFRCDELVTVDELTIEVDKQAPIRSRWSAKVQREVEEPTSECVKPRLSTSGQKIGCDLYGTRTVHRSMPVGGVLELVATK